jgi:hypothetical protein
MISKEDIYKMQEVIKWGIVFAEGEKRSLLEKMLIIVSERKIE